MIKLNVDKNEVRNSQLTRELYDYLQTKGHSTINVNKKTLNAKADIILSLTIGSFVMSTYPLIKDLVNWARPRKYTLTITDGNVSQTLNDLSEEQYIKILNKLNKDITYIELD